MASRCLDGDAVGLGVGIDRRIGRVCIDCNAVAVQKQLCSQLGHAGRNRHRGKRGVVGQGLCAQALHTTRILQRHQTGIQKRLCADLLHGIGKRKFRQRGITGEGGLADRLHTARDRHLGQAVADGEAVGADDL